ncbi:MAG: class I SAM-dependent methyltransferase [Dehalococcoidia bacterium]
MTRPQIGTNPSLAKLETETYVDFIEGLFRFIGKLEPTLRQRAEAELADYRERVGHDPQDVDEAHAVLGRLPIVAARHRIRHSIQDMNHDAILSDLRSREAELVAELDRYDRLGPGSVQYDPNWTVPAYAAREIHRMPGGYVTDPLAGYLYQYSTKSFFGGRNDRDEFHTTSVGKLPVPVDGQVRRILDIGCSAGQSATALKQRFPQAEVWAIDVGIPMLRYAHKRAVDLGVEVHFKQALAEQTGFPDGSFDLVHAFILFHELPQDIAVRVVAEAARVLRPGGLFLVTDFQTRHSPRGDGRGGGILGEVMGSVDQRHNEEPYRWDFTHSDFEGLLGRYFSKVEVRAEGYGMPLRVATR